MTRRAVVVGSGPNGLAAAITLARSGVEVTVLEATHRIGGAASSAELTLPGFIHDLGSAIHPLAVASPFFHALPLHAFGLDWVQPDLPVAHPLPGGAALLRRDLDETADGLEADGPAYRRLMRPLVQDWEALMDELLRPLPHLPRHLPLLARFGVRALPPASLLARTLFRGESARALLGGLAAHSGLPLFAPGTMAFALMLGVTAHAVGWPFPRGGAGELSAALAACLRFLGGRIETGVEVTGLNDLPSADAVLLDLSPQSVLDLAGDRLPARYAAWLRRFRPGPGAFKVDYALNAKIPWADARVGRAGTVHLGGPLPDVEAAERAPGEGRISSTPYVLLAQHTPFDPSRAPAGQHTAWAYIHVPNGSQEDALEALEGQIERSAPGFRSTVLARHVSTPAALHAWNANLLGGDVNGGANSLWQLLARPVPTAAPYRTPLRGVYLCSASTPPGGGVHGMCGFWAAQTALADVFGIREGHHTGDG